MSVKSSIPGVKALMDIGCGKRLGWGVDPQGRGVYCRVGHPCNDCQRRIAQLDMKEVIALVQELEVKRQEMMRELERQLEQNEIELQ